MKLQVKRCFNTIRDEALRGSLTHRMYYTVICTHVQAHYTPGVKTMQMQFKKGELRIEYSDQYKKLCCAADLPGYVLFGILHEIEHYLLGHCYIDFAAIKKVHPEVTMDLLNIAADYQVNRKILLDKNLMEFYFILATLEKTFLLPPRDVLPHQEGHFMYWVRYLLKHPNTVEKILGQQPSFSSGIFEKNDVEKEELNRMLYPVGKSRKATEKYIVSELQWLTISKTSREYVEKLPSSLKGYLSRVQRGVGSTYKKLNKLNYTGIVTSARLPVRRLEREKTIVFFVDVSGSMRTEKLQKAYSLAVPFVKRGVSLFYATCDTEIREMGRLTSISTIKDIWAAGGGTRFYSALQRLVRMGHSNFVIYTDSEVDSPILPPEVSPSKVHWLITRSDIWNKEILDIGSYEYV